MPEREHATPPDPLPLPPVEPDPADCCGEGCARCIWDAHAEAQERYRERLAAWRSRHPDDH
ncbi:MAG: hypothetical protein H0T88_01055 [Lysobacter sp.]|nr:hypothetical protein [Lysobacter sp.]